MGVGKEAIIALEELAARQVQVYPDACDVGVPVSERVTATVRRALGELRDLEGGVTTRGRTWTAYETRLAYEHDGDAICGVTVKVTRYKDRRARFPAWYDIEIRPATWLAGA